MLAGPSLSCLPLPPPPPLLPSLPSENWHTSGAVVLRLWTPEQNRPNHLRVMPSQRRVEEDGLELPSSRSLQRAVAQRTRTGELMSPRCALMISEQQAVSGRSPGVRVDELTPALHGA